MSSETTENPVMLWGDMGPDVYKLSQIYDPRNDKYVTTSDASIVENKDYYERLSLILTTDEVIHGGRQYYCREVDAETGAVTFKPVIPAQGDNPRHNGWYQDSGGKVLVFSKVDLSQHPADTSPVENFWYEENTDPVNTCGKYVPEVDSLVVVDETDCPYKLDNNYRTRMLLTVKSVDRALNVTFATVVFGSEIEETIRAIDYGNEKFMLFFDRKAAGAGNIQLTPDRKLLIYGKNSYGYRLKRDGVIISSNLPTIQVRDDAFIPYARATAQRTTLTQENFQALQGKMLDVVLPSGLQRTMLCPADKALLIRTCDITFRKNVKYYAEDGSSIITDGLVNEPVAKEGGYDVGILDDEGHPVNMTKFYDDDEAQTLTSDAYFVAGKTYYVKYNDEVYIADTSDLCGVNISDWEAEDPRGRKVCRPAFDDEAYRALIGQSQGRWNGDLIDRVAYAHESTELAVGSVFVPESCYLKSNFSIVEGESIQMEIYSFDVETNYAHMVMNVTLIAKEAAALDTTDITTRRITNFDVEINGNDNAGDIWYLQQGDNVKTSFSMMPKITFDDGSDMTVPIDNRSCYVYGLEDVKSALVGREFQILFKFFPHKRLNVDWQKIGMTPTKNFLTCRKTIKIINNLSNTIRKIALIPAWNQVAQQYSFYFMIFRTDFEAPPIIRSGIDTKYRIQTFKITEDTVSRKYTAEDGIDLDGQMKHYYRKLNSGKFLDLNITSEGVNLTNLGYDVYETAVHPKTSIYDVQYINENGDEAYVPSASAGSVFDAVQHAILAEKVYADNITASSLYTQPIAFKIQNLMLSDPTWRDASIPWLIGDDCTGWTDDLLPYGNTHDGRPYLLYNYERSEQVEDRTIKVGSFRVDKSAFANVEAFLLSFYQNTQPPKCVSGEENASAEEFIPTHFYLRSCSDDSVVSDFVAINGENDELYIPTTLAGGGDASTTIGGAHPSIIHDDQYGLGDVHVMGTVIMEFVYRYTDPEDPTKFKYKHLFAAPVEVRDVSWPAREGE